MKHTMYKGFTLMEVMIVVVIVAALLLIAVPNYQDQVIKTRRSDAMNTLMDIASRQEKHMLDRSTYVFDLSSLGQPGDYTDPWISPEEWYEVTASSVPAGCERAFCYRLTATPRSGSPQEADEECTSFILNSTGLKDATGTKKDECW